MSFSNIFEYEENIENCPQFELYRNIQNTGSGNLFSIAFAVSPEENLSVGFSTNIYSGNFENSSKYYFLSNYTKERKDDTLNYMLISENFSNFQEKGKNVSFGFKYSLTEKLTIGYKITSPYRITHTQEYADYIEHVPSFSSIGLNYSYLYIDYRFQNYKHSKISYEETPPFYYYSKDLSSFSVALKGEYFSIGYQLKKYLSGNYDDNSQLKSHFAAFGVLFPNFKISTGLEYCSDWLFRYDVENTFSEKLDIFKIYLGIDINLQYKY